MFNSFIHSPFSSIFKCSLKKAFKYLFKIRLWREIDNGTFYILLFLVKVWCGNIISLPIHLGTIDFWISWFGGTAYQEGEEIEAGRGTLISNLCLISHRWYDVEKLTVLGNSNLNLTFSVTQSIRVQSLRIGLTLHGSLFKNKHFVLSRAKELLKLNNTINRLNIILYYSYSLNIFECLIYQIYQ